MAACLVFYMSNLLYSIDLFYFSIFFQLVFDCSLCGFLYKVPFLEFYICHVHVCFYNRLKLDEVIVFNPVVFKIHRRNMRELSDKFVEKGYTLKAFSTYV